MRQSKIVACGARCEECLTSHMTNNPWQNKVRCSRWPKDARMYTRIFCNKQETSILSDKTLSVRPS